MRSLARVPDSRFSARRRRQWRALTHSRWRWPHTLPYPIPTLTRVRACARSPFGVLGLDYMERPPDVEQSSAPLDAPPPPPAGAHAPGPAHAPAPAGAPDAPPAGPPRGARAGPDALKRTQSEAGLGLGQRLGKGSGGGGGPLARLPQDEALRAIADYLASAALQCAPAQSLCPRKPARACAARAAPPWRPGCPRLPPSGLCGAVPLGVLRSAVAPCAGSSRAPCPAGTYAVLCAAPAGRPRRSGRRAGASAGDVCFARVTAHGAVSAAQRGRCKSRAMARMCR